MAERPRKKDGPPSLTTAAEKLAFGAMIAEVRRLYAGGEVDAALELAARIGEAMPEIPRTAIPIVVMTRSEILALPLDHRAGFMLTRIDGNSTVQQILDVAAMDADEALAVLENLLALGALALAPKDPSESSFGEISLPELPTMPTVTPTTPIP